MDDKQALTAALDEIYELRIILAQEASNLERVMALKTVPKSVRETMGYAVTRMRYAAQGKRFTRPGDNEALAELRGTSLLTRDMWEKERRG